MKPIKYIYFEVFRKTVQGLGWDDPRIQNENILLIKPKTNSSGIWVVNHLHKFHDNDNISGHFLVDQYWIDLDKYKPSKMEIDSRLVKMAMGNLRPYIRNKLISEIFE